MVDVYSSFLDEFESFTKIQEKAIPVIEAGENCIITAAPGSGKTEAALLPILKRIAGGEFKDPISLVYITPLRALNRDLLKRLKLLCGKFGISVEVRHGDTSQSERAKQSKHPPSILITTPESLQSLLLTKYLYVALRNVKCVIVDELHELYYNKRGAQLSVALERLSAVAGNFQRIGISATIGDIDTAALFLCNKRACKVIGVDEVKKMNVKIEMPKRASQEHAAFVEKFSLDKESLARIEHISNLIRESQATLIFANTRQIVESLGNKLLYYEKLEPFGSISVHHSSLDKEERIATENSFKEGRVKSIIATSSLELGIDIGKIDLVIQYGSPRQVTRMVQRVGRSGHTEKETSKGRIIVASVIDTIESAAIVALSKENILEKKGMQMNAQDVLLNQISEIALEYKQIDVEKIRSMIRGSANYAGIRDSELDNLLRFAEEQRLIRYDGKMVAVGGRARGYMIENLSVIPDAIKFLVKNISTNKIISSLDEEFVYNIDEGTTFITKGLVWKVVSIDEQTIYVEPSTEIDAAIPDWDGEDIPVSREVARFAFSLLDPKNLEHYKGLMDESAYTSTLQLAVEQAKHFNLDESVLAVEEMENRAIIYTALGKRANDLLARMIGVFALSNTGKNIITRSTAYAIILEYENYGRVPDVKRILESFRDYDIDKLVQNTSFLISFELFRYKFVQIAKLFGVVEKKATITRNVATKLINFYKDSPIYAETIRDLRENYFDIDGLKLLQKRLREKKTRIDMHKTYGSPLTNEILKSAYFYRELMAVLVPGSAEIEQFAEGLMNKKVELVCTYCGARFSNKISEFGEEQRILCPLCKSPMVAVYSEEYEKVIEKRKNNERLGKKEVNIYGEALASASLVDAYKIRALLALATYGVGIKTAARVLKMLRKDPKMFLIDLINAQKLFIKNKKYWSDR